jgi:hypothetical protein
MDDRWRDSYDTWKLASPYDDDFYWRDDDQEPDYDAELDFESLIATYR